MKGNKDLNPVGELKIQLNTPKTETRIILETEDLYPDLVYEDVSSSRGYGPGRGLGDGNNKKKNRNNREKLELMLVVASQQVLVV